MKKSYSILATVALALSLNSVAAWAVEKAGLKPQSEKSQKSGNQGKPDKILVKANVQAVESSPDCKGGGGGGL